jgi:hypothetical protein
MSSLSILWLFGKFVGHLVYFFPFGTLYNEQSGNPVQIAKRGRLYAVKKVGMQQEVFFKVQFLLFTVFP